MWLSVVLTACHKHWAGKTYLWIAWLVRLGLKWSVLVNTNDRTFLVRTILAPLTLGCSTGPGWKARLLWSLGKNSFGKIKWTSFLSGNPVLPPSTDSVTSPIRFHLASSWLRGRRPPAPNCSMIESWSDLIMFKGQPKNAITHRSFKSPLVRSKKATLNFKVC